MAVESPLGGGFRDHLDLSAVVDRYEVFNPALAGTSAQRRQPRAAVWRRPGEGLEPERAGVGPTRCSTSRQVASTRLCWAWDPNRYYRDLGIAWPYVHATKKDLREAYMSLHGQTSERLTYCFKQLLNIRPDYDALPLGVQWLDDIYVQDAMKRQAALEAGRRTMAGQYATASEVLDEWGYQVLLETPETPASVIDSDHLDQFNEPVPPETVGGDWHYAFYLWKTTDPDTHLLAAWQAALVSQINPRISPTLVVGLMGKQPHEYVIAQVAGEWVVFLNCDAEVSPDLARRATTALRNDIMREARRA